MKKISLFVLIILTCTIFCSCSFLGFGKKKYDVSGTTWSDTQTTWIPYETYTIEFSESGYTLTYHRDALSTKEAKQDAVDLFSEGTWSLYEEREISWTGDWNIKQKVKYYVLKLSNHTSWEDGAYFCFKPDGNVAYLRRTVPTENNDYSDGFRLVKAE